MKKPEYTTICKNGVTYMMRNGICKNISNVDDSVEEVTFGDGIDIINIPEGNVYEQVKRICIGKSVISIHVPNSLFPNVREVKSSNDRYPSGTMLTEKEFSFGKERICLKNSFCLRKDETLDLKGIYSIECRALKNCSAGNVANTEDVKIFDRYAFSQTKLPRRKLPDEYGVRMIGTMLIDINKGCRKFVIPEDTTSIAGEVYIYSTSTIDVRCSNEVFFRYSKVLFWMRDYNIILNGRDHIDKSVFEKLHGSNIIFNTENYEYTVIDNIIYTKDMKTIVKCNRTGEDNRKVVIPDTVTEISNYAFYNNSEITELEIPGSVKRIGSYAFANCVNLRSVKIENGVKELGNTCFVGLTALEELKLPGSVDVVDTVCNIQGKNRYIEINEGTKKVKLWNDHYPYLYKSFYASIKLPKTITGFSRNWRNELTGIRVAVLDSENVPKNTLLAMMPLHRPKPCTFHFGFEEAIKNELYCIQTPKRRIFIPSDITEPQLARINDALNSTGSAIPANIFQYCKNTNQKLPMAFLEWQQARDDVTEKYLKRNRKKLVQALILAAMDEELARFLDTGIFQKKEMEDVYGMIAEADGMEMSKAYALNASAGKEKNVFRI